MDRLKKYQEIYVKEHGYEEECKKFTQNGKHDCEKCVKESEKVHITCPTYPMYSDQVTKVLTYENLFEVHAADKKDLAEKTTAIREEKDKNSKSKWTAEWKIDMSEYAVTTEAQDLAVETEIEDARQNAEKLAKKKVELEKIKTEQTQKAEQVQKVLINLEKVDEQSTQFGRVSADRLSGVEMGEGFSNISTLIKQAKQIGEEIVAKRIEEAKNTSVNINLFEDAMEGETQNESQDIDKSADADDKSDKSS